MKFNKTQLSFLILAIMLVALPVILYLSRQPQQIKSRAFDRGTVALQFSPASSDPATPLLVNKPLEVTLQMNVGDFNKVTGIDVKVRYNDSLTLNSFEPDSSSGLDKVVLTSSDPTNRVYHYIAVTSQTNISSSGVVNVGKLKFAAAKEGQANLSVTDNPTLTAAAQQGALTVSSTNGTYTIGNVTPTATPSGSLTPTGVTGQCINGDIGDNNCVDNADFGEWFKQFTGISSDRNLRGELKADFYPVCKDGKRGDGVINGADLNVWIRESNGTNRCK